MAKNNQASLINRGLDKFSHFLSNELAQVTNLAAEIPDQAYIFHGSYNDPALTEVEIEKAADLLVRMQLGVEEEAPVIILFEYAPNNIASLILPPTNVNAKPKNGCNHFANKVDKLLTTKSITDNS